MSDLHSRIGLNIQRLMLERGIKTQKDLAHAAKLHPVQLHKILTGKSAAGVDILNRIAEALGAEIRDLTSQFELPPSTVLAAASAAGPDLQPTDLGVTEKSLMVKLIHYSDLNAQLFSQVLELNNTVKDLTNQLKEMKEEIKRLQEELRASASAAVSQAK